MGECPIFYFVFGRDEETTDGGSTTSESQTVVWRSAYADERSEVEY